MDYYVHFYQVHLTIMWALSGAYFQLMRQKCNLHKGQKNQEAQVTCATNYFVQMAICNKKMVQKNFHKKQFGQKQFVHQALLLKAFLHNQQFAQTEICT